MNHTFKLHYFPLSTNSRKVLLTAHHLGVQLDLVPVDLTKGEQRRPDFLALNPMGRIPVLQEGDFVLPESHAIMGYLADGRTGHTLYPREPRVRAQVDRWLFWGSAHWGPAIAGLSYENVIKKIKGAGDPDPAFVNHYDAMLRGLATVLDAQLASRAWVAGPSLTLADFAIAAPLTMMIPAKLPLESFSNVQAWFERVQALDAWKATQPPPLPAR